MHNTSTVAKHMNTHATAMLTRTRQHYRNAQTHVKNLTHTHKHTVTHMQKDEDRCTQPQMHKQTHKLHTHASERTALYRSVFSSGSPCSPVHSNPTAVCPAASQPLTCCTDYRSGVEQPPSSVKNPLWTPDEAASVDIATAACGCILHVVHRGERGVLAFSRITHMVVSLPVS